MDDKFKDVPLEDDTRLLITADLMVGKYKTLFQYWYWDGFFGKSLIFCEADVETLTDAELKDVLAKAEGNTLLEAEGVIAEEDMTVSRRCNGYAFVNFGFERGDD